MPGDIAPTDSEVTDNGPQSIRYSSAIALDAAIRDRIRNALAESPLGAAEIRRQFAYDRLLTRIFLSDPDGWILKGGTGLLARIPDVARHSLDIDVFRRTSIEAAVVDLTAAGDIDLGDFFTFDIERDSEMTGLHPGIRCRTIAYLGDKEFDRFRVDIVIDTNITGVPANVAPLSPIHIEGLPTTRYRLYPIADHIADKHAAMIDTYGDGEPSSRYRDLVDLVLIAKTQSVHAEDLRRALLSEYTYRGLDTPTTVTLPSSNWRQGYADIARDVPNFDILDADSAIAIVRAMIELALDGTAWGTWDPNALRWESR